MASIYQALGHLEKALRLFKEGYRLSTEVLGAKHPDTLISLNNLASIYQALGRLKEALPLFETGHRLKTEVLGAKHPDTLTSLNNLANIYQSLGRLKEALALFETGHRLKTEVLGAKHPSTLLTLNNLGFIYNAIGRLSEALPLLEKSNRLLTEVLGKKHLDTLSSLNNLATIYQDLGSLSEALPLLETVYRLSKEVLGKKHLDTLSSLNNLASIYQALGRLKEALPLFETGYRLRTEVLGAKHPDTLTSLNNLANIYQSLGRLKEALALFETGHRLKTEVLGAKHPSTLLTLNNLGFIYNAIGRLSEALPLLEKSNRLLTEVLGKKHLDTLSSLNNLATIYRDLGHLSEALSLSEKGYRLSTEVLGAKHPYTIRSLNNLATIYQDLGSLSEALPLLENVYRLSKEVLGKKHPFTLLTLNNLTMIYKELGRLSEALPLLEKGYRLSEKVLGEKHPYTTLTINNLAGIYKELGSLSEALPLLEKGYRLYKELLGEKHPDSLTSLTNLAFIYKDLGSLSKALPLFEKSYRLRKEVLGEKHPYTLSSLNNLATIYRDLGSLSEALPLREKGYRLRKEVLGKTHPDTLTSLNNLALIYYHLGSLSEALPLFEKGYRLYKKVLGEKHPDTLISLNNLAYIYAKQGKTNKAIKHFEKVVEVVEQLRSGDFSAENRQTLFKQWVHGYLTLAGLYISQSRYQDAFRLAEMSKARTLLESMTMTLAAQKAGLSKAERQQLQQYQARIAVFNERIAKENEYELDKKLTLEMEKNQLVKEAADFHRTLMKQYPKYAQLNDVQIVDAETGASLIPEDALFISYLFQQNNVLVFTLDTKGNLQAKNLGEIPNLDQTLKTYTKLLGEQCPVSDRGCEGKYVLQLDDGSFVIKDELARGEQRQQIDNIDEISRYLGEKLLEPLKDLLAGKQHLIISPDGGLALIPFETLILGDKPVIATHHVSYVQSLSVLALLKKREALYKTIKNRRTLLAMGAARYEQPGQSNDPKKCNKAQRMPKYNLETMLSRNVADPKRYQRAFRTLGIPWCNLPGTEKELNEVERIFAETQPLIFRKEQATEAKLQSLNKEGILPRYRYILFSAHGYLSLKVPALSAVVLDQLSKTKDTDPDGYITASEWPSYFLTSDLMVLSACQTGVGKIMHGEGIMGLPYALYVAGNKNTLLTLWSINDDKTAEFITSFFTKLKAGQGQIDALTATKREFINKGKPYSNPKYWAAFVLYGV